jgi:uncharacterized protein involved in exopolysaccharide biosynthesis
MLSQLFLVMFLANPVVHDIEGTKFVCFDKQWAQELLQLRVDFPKIQKQVVVLKELVASQDKQLVAYAGLSKNYDMQIVELSEEVRLLNTKIQDDNVWWRNRLLILGVGVVGGISVAIGIVYLIKAATLL